MDLEPDTPAIDRSASVTAPAESWGEDEIAREIALLQAHLCEEKISRIIDRAMEALVAVDGVPLDDLSRGRPADIEEELRQSYLDYALSVIIGRALPYEKAIRNIRTLSRRALALFPHLTHRLSAAASIYQLIQANRACSALFLKLRRFAEAALYGLPLFAYGPELNEFRHRHR